MGYKALLDTNINKAFNLLKNLADDVTLVKKTANSFSFSTGDVTVTEASSVSTKAIITEVNKKSDVHNIMTKLALLKTQDVGDLNAYDKLTLGGNEWKFGPTINSDNFITTVEIFREV